MPYANEVHVCRRRGAARCGAVWGGNDASRLRLGRAVLRNLLNMTLSFLHCVSTAFIYCGSVTVTFTLQSLL